MERPLSRQDLIAQHQREVLEAVRKRFNLPPQEVERREVSEDGRRVRIVFRKLSAEA